MYYNDRIIISSNSYTDIRKCGNRSRKDAAEYYHVPEVSLKKCERIGSLLRSFPKYSDIIRKKLSTAQFGFLKFFMGHDNSWGFIPATLTEAP
jgi:hypothetical protein